MDSLPGNRGIRIAHILQWMLWAALVGLLLILYLRPGSFWIVSHHAYPPLRALVFAAVYLGLTFARGIPRRVRPWLLSAALLGVYLTTRVCPLGDHDYWRYLARTDVLFVSQPLANAVYRGVYVAFGPEALAFVSPVSGFFSALACFAVCDRLFLQGRVESDAAGRRLCAVYYLGSGIQLIFFFNYVETTQLSVAPLYLYILALDRYCRGRDGEGGGLPRRNRELILAAFLLALAALMHAQIVFLFPSLPLAILIRRGLARQFGRMRRELVVMAVTLAATVAAAALVLHAVGFSFDIGHAGGGGDSTMFVPLALDQPEADRRFGMFWVEHFLQMANIVVMASPAAFALPLLVAVKAATRGERFPLGPWSLALPALGYLGFVFLWNFDLGVPGDYDLMISMAVPLNLVVLEFLLRGFRRSRGERLTAWFVVAGGVGMTWMFMGSVLKPIDGGAGVERMPIGKGPGIVLEAVSTAPGTATLRVGNVPHEYDHGYVFYSTRVDHPIGSGPFFGLVPDECTAVSLRQLQLEGSAFHFPYHTARLFPNAPVTVGSASKAMYRGLTVDCVVVFVDRSLKPVGVSNVARVTTK